MKINQNKSKTKPNKTRQDSMNEFIESTHYQNPDGSEFTGTPGYAEDESAGGIPFIINQPGAPSLETIKYEMPSDFNIDLTISAIVRVESCKIDPDSVYSDAAFCKRAGITEGFTSFIITGVGMSPTFSFFPVEIHTQPFAAESLSEMTELFKPGAIFVAEGEYGKFEPHLDTIVIFQADITLLPSDSVAVLKQNFQHAENYKVEFSR